MGSGPLCEGCSLATIGKGWVPLEWQPEKFKGLLIVGEGAGEAEAREGLPFRPYAMSGALLAKVMKSTNIARSEVAICNVISCHAPKDWLLGAPWEYSAISHCTENNLKRFIQEVQPKAILAVGAVAYATLVSRPKGKYGTLDFARGFVSVGAGVAEGIPVIATYHPAFIRRGAAHLTSSLQRDLRRAFLIATGKLREGEHFYTDISQAPIQYQTTVAVVEAWEFARSINNDLPIFWDCETPRTSRDTEDERTSFTDRDIKLFQATQHKGRGIAIPYRDEFIEVIRFILATPTLKVTQNGWNFDEPVAKGNGIEINLDKGSDDVMVMFGRVEPDLPANLQAIAQYCGFPFPWKAIGDSDIEFYGVADVDALAWAYPVLKAVMERENLWDAYVRYFRQYHPILLKMAERGVPISEKNRLELKYLVEKEELAVDEKIRAMVPEEVLSQKQKNGYKNPPILKCEECGYEGRGDHFCKANGNVEEMSADAEDNDDSISSGGIGVRVVGYSELAEQNGLVLREVTIKEEEKCRCTKKNRSGCDVCAGVGIIPAGLVEMRWAALTEFNPNSHVQVKRFLRYLKHPVPKHQKRIDELTGEAAETTEVKELERLYTKTKHPIYPLLIEKRQLSKLMGVYVEGWAPGKDGRIHATFSHKATWQPSSKAPNIFNGIKRGRTPEQKARVKAFNAMQCAEEGHLLINIDMRSFHAQTLACEVGHADYLRLAKLDQHSFVTCHGTKHPERHNLLKWSNADLKAFFTEMKADKTPRYPGPSGLMTFKEARDGKFKSCGLAVGFGMQGRKMYQMYQEDFINESEAKGISHLLQDELFDGAIGKWQKKVKAEAAEEGLLRSKYNGIRRFYDVERWSPKEQKMMGGEQAEAAIAFLPAANAFGYMRDAQLRCEELGYLDRFEMVNSVYDSLQLHVLERDVEEAIRLVVPVLEAPSKVLIYPICPEGLSVEAEASVGPNLAEMEEF
jgi:uracil-DNA glycosylase family 4